MTGTCCCLARRLDESQVSDPVAASRRLPVRSDRTSPCRQPECRRIRSFLELARQDAHADQVAAMNAFKALRDHGFHASRRVPFAAQSRELPVPYSCPANTISGTPSA